MSNHTYFIGDAKSLSDEEIVSLATRQAHDIEDLTLRSDATRKQNDNERRKADLTLGELIHLAANPEAVISAVAKSTTFTPSGLRERRDIYAATADESTAMKRLLEMGLSYSDHRTIVGIRVKKMNPQRTTNVHDCIDAAQRSIERNKGVFKADDIFYNEVNLLPPPNSAERVLVNLENDPAYAEKILDGPMGNRLVDVIVKHVKDDDETKDRSRNRRKKGEIADLVGNVTLALEALTTAMFDRDDVPGMVVNERPLWDKQLGDLDALITARTVLQ